MNDAELYMPALTRSLFHIGVWLCLSSFILVVGVYIIARIFWRPTKFELLDALEIISGLWASIICALSIIFGLSIFGIQIVLLAKTGNWNGVSVATVLRLIGFDLSSIYSPTDWKGLAILASWPLAFPLSLTALLFGGYAYYLANDVWSGRKKLRKLGEHPQPGDPDYLDWANHRGTYAKGD